MEVWRERSRRATIVLVVTSAVLIGPAAAGVGATLWLAAVLGGLTGSLWAVREPLGELPTVVGYDVGEHARDGWVGTALGTAVVVLTLGAPAVELQAFGGLAGLIGMVNYFVRPLYLFLVAAIDRAIGGDGGRRSR